MESETSSRGLCTGTWCEYCVEYVLAYERVYSHSDVDSYDVQSQMVRRQL